MKPKVMAVLLPILREHKELSGAQWCALADVKQGSLWNGLSKYRDDRESQLPEDRVRIVRWDKNNHRPLPIYAFGPEDDASISDAEEDDDECGHRRDVHIARLAAETDAAVAEMLPALAALRGNVFATCIAQIAR